MFNLITSNIRFDNPNDGEHVWSNRKAILANILLNNSPAIIATQEGREPQLKELASTLKAYQLSESHRDWIEQRMYPSLYIHEQYPILASGDIWLSQTPYIAGSSSFNSTFPRLSTWAQTHIKNNKVIIANLHLDHVSEATRIEQVQVFCHEFKKVLKKESDYIICGDFNSDPHADVWKYLVTELKLTDPWVTLAKEEESSHHQFLGSLESGSRIDWVLHSSNLECTKIEMLKQSIGGIYPSDHFPVLAQFKF